MDLDPLAKSSPWRDSPVAESLSFDPRLEEGVVYPLLDFLLKSVRVALAARTAFGFKVHLGFETFPGRELLEWARRRQLLILCHIATIEDFNTFRWKMSSTTSLNLPCFFLIPVDFPDGY